jgi:hypothetical protein
MLLKASVETVFSGPQNSVVNRGYQPLRLLCDTTADIASIKQLLYPRGPKQLSVPLAKVVTITECGVLTSRYCLAAPSEALQLRRAYKKSAGPWNCAIALSEHYVKT